MNLLTIKNLTKAHTNKVLFDDVDFAVNDNEKIGFIGINGTGKSTLLRIIAGLDEPDAGTVIKGNNVHIRYLPQMPVFENGSTIYDYVVTQNKNSENEWTIEGDAKTILNKMGFDNYDLKVDSLSGGEKKRVALCAVLLAKADILILDEPTNHLDRWMINYLEDYLKKYKGSLVMVTHDRYFLDRVCNRIVEIDRRKLYSYETNYEGFLELKAAREDSMESSYLKRKNILRRELEWIKRGAKARSTKQKARIDRYEQLKNTEYERMAQSSELTSVYTRMGKKTIELEHVTKVYDGKMVVNDFTYIFLKGESVAFVGHNGCGKSTLMRLITGNETPDFGTVTIGDTITIGYFSQESTEMDPEERVIDYIKDVAEYVQTPEGSVSASVMLERFLFDATLQYSKIGVLSGGERRRLYLIRILMSAPNVLILDEPTNDLDIQTLSILEDYIDNFQGITIMVSHDRYFLDRAADRVFVFDDNGVITEDVYNDVDAILDSTTGNSKGAVAEKSADKSSKGSVSEKTNEKTTWDKGEKALKFTYAEAKEYDTIESDIEKIETRLSAIEDEMVKNATDFVKLRDLTNEKEKLTADLDYKMERWEYLILLAEKIEESKKAKGH